MNAGSGEGTRMILAGEAERLACSVAGGRGLLVEPFRDGLDAVDTLAESVFVAGDALLSVFSGSLGPASI